MKSRVLLVDDEPTILFTMKAILEIQGYEVETANSETAAVRKLGESEFHLVITDLKLEKMDSGFALAAAAKSRPYKPAVAILTAYPVLASDWRSKGADMIFLKPTKTQDMLQSIEGLISSRDGSRGAAAREKLRGIGNDGFGG